jgi:hypothetical protein
VEGTKTLGFVFLIGLWIILTFLCYCKVIVFDNTTLGGAMISGLVLATSILGVVRLLKAAYDAAYSTVVEEKD